MAKYDIVAETKNATVVAEYSVEYGKSKHSDAFQSEAELEQEFIRMLQEQGYEYLSIHDEQDLIVNLRKCLEELNNYRFTDKEWEFFFSNVIANKKEHIVEKTRKIQQDETQVLKCDDGTTRNIRLIEKECIHNNKLQVINQYTETSGKHENRYDVTILVNGLPLVHVELKRRGVSIREAFNQINRYQRESFWAAHGLYEYVQIFVISNGTCTKYYSNTTRDNAVNAKEKKVKSNTQTSNSFEFTSYWSDSRNNLIRDLIDFTKTFFAKHTILNILTKFCVFNVDNILLVMRPYQIAATERILNRIKSSMNYKRSLGTKEAGGYIWHTTGSGKTLTSFKTAQLAMGIPDISKVIFVVDRNDLDYQTIKEYENFQKGSVSQSKNTDALKKHLDNDEKSDKVIVTTIQKLSIFVKKHSRHSVYHQNVVFIFDECHRSQFGDMHKLITKTFKKYMMFGFTGTPIFAKNAKTAGNINMRTTEDTFGERLHTYTILDAIRDQNVLRWKIDYLKTVDSKIFEDEKIPAIDKEKALLNPRRIEEVVKYILNNYNTKTLRNGGGFYKFNKLQNIAEVAKDMQALQVKSKVNVKGFNSILAVASVSAAKAYYAELKKQMADNPTKKLNVALIYSYAPNEDVDDNGLLYEEDNDGLSGLDQSSRDFLEQAIKDYNEMFKVKYNTDKEFANYYKDVSLRMKNKELDLLVVCNMFLTGFDATTLNTLWVDKSLKMHGLIQSFSRTNRILNSVKRYGNIVCFRNLEKQTNEALALFGDKDAAGVVLIRPYKDYYIGYNKDGKHHDGYVEVLEQLQTKYPLGVEIIGESAEKDFIRLFGKLLRLRNILISFDEFVHDDTLGGYDFSNYTAYYNDLYEKYKSKPDKVDISEDLEFEMELVKQIEVNIDYILMLIEKYVKSNRKDKEIGNAIDKAIGASTELRSKRDLIEGFITSVNNAKDIVGDWHRYVVEKKDEELEGLIKDENLKVEETKIFMNTALENGTLNTDGTDIDFLLPPMSLFGKDNRVEKLKIVVKKLVDFFDKFLGIV